MTPMVASLFAKAWRREPFPFVQRLWRGVVWFALYLAMLVVHNQIAYGSLHVGWRAIAWFLLGLIPIWIFWTFTPALLVRDGGRGLKFLMGAGFAGMMINSVILALAMRWFFPMMLKGWTGFGAIGVGMLVMTWCGFLGIGWVATACVGAVMWERSAPESMVLAAEAGESPATTS